MPIYEYRRPDGSTFEVMQKMTDEPLTADPETGVPVQRVFRPVAVHFKGSGFHNTDYGTRKRNKEKEAESKGSSDSSGDSKPDSKPDGAKKPDPPAKKPDAA
jgi:putative FmdB family regulatory protein